MKKWIPYIFLLFFYLSSSSILGQSLPTDDSPNIILIIADDMGKDATNGFSQGTIKPHTPHLDNIKNNGLSFSNFWVNPTCSPTRAAIISGKYGYRTGVKWAGDELPSSETICQKYIAQETNNKYANAVIGKWHLNESNSTFNPETLGIDYFAGMMKGGTKSYYQWKLSEDGATSSQTQYITEKFTDLAMDWVKLQTKPWFLWLAYNAPHTPFHAPPTHMHSQGQLSEYSNRMDALPYYMAAIEAMDYQIGRLLSSLNDQQRENTLIIFIGDNGTPRRVAQKPYTNKAKGTLYEGGINTPMFISGKGVLRNGMDSSLINQTDLFATIAQISGAKQAEIFDSKSFLPLLRSAQLHRNYLYSEMDDGQKNIWAVRSAKYKIIADPTGSIEMYDLYSDPDETRNLLSNELSLEEKKAKVELEKKLKEIRN